MMRCWRKLSWTWMNWHRKINFTLFNRSRIYNQILDIYLRKIQVANFNHPLHVKNAQQVATEHTSLKTSTKMNNRPSNNLIQKAAVIFNHNHLKNIRKKSKIKSVGDFHFRRLIRMFWESRWRSSKMLRRLKKKRWRVVCRILKPNILLNNWNHRLRW